MVHQGNRGRRPELTAPEHLLHMQRTGTGTHSAGVGGRLCPDAPVNDEIADSLERLRRRPRPRALTTGLGDPATREARWVLLEPWLAARPRDVARLACGAGWLTAPALGSGPRSSGVDLTDNMVARARAKTVEFAERVTFKSRDVWAAPVGRLGPGQYHRRGRAQPHLNHSQRLPP
jgi:SAM-dependent methyltransferase